ncbi:hypothetical protein [Vibrio agarivorans]|uniref:hypothetical protein n=1 Tax=Vibrio agarivorans TaxID=153622 RepID=UPI0025B37F91|nr:hypothetical protein [Vibrio agarivorans]MDN3661133.1 hypothetical protein [Vibrio agarivorans]
MRLTVKRIIATVAERTGINPEYIDLINTSDGYVWAGKCGSVFTEMSTFNKLSDVSLERWVEDFEYRVNQEINRLEFDDLNSYIESIDWSVDYEP